MKMKQRWKKMVIAVVIMKLLIFGMLKVQSQKATILSLKLIGMNTWQDNKNYDIINRKEKAEMFFFFYPLLENFRKFPWKKKGLPSCPQIFEYSDFWITLDFFLLLWYTYPRDKEWWKMTERYTVVWQGKIMAYDVPKYRVSSIFCQLSRGQRIVQFRVGNTYYGKLRKVVDKD